MKCGTLSFATNVNSALFGPIWTKPRGGCSKTESDDDVHVIEEWIGIHTGRLFLSESRSLSRSFRIHTGNDSTVAFAVFAFFIVDASGSCDSAYDPL